MKLQNNDTITFLKILQDYMEHLLRYLFTKIINKTSIFITFSAVLIGNFIFPELTASMIINAISQTQVAPHILKAASEFTSMRSAVIILLCTES